MRMHPRAEKLALVDDRRLAIFGYALSAYTLRPAGHILALLGRPHENWMTDTSFSDKKK